MFTEADRSIAHRFSFDLAKRPIALTEESSGRLRAANPAFLALVGRSEEEIGGLSLVDLGLWADEGQRNSFLNCLVIEGALNRYPLAPSPRFPDTALYATVDVLIEGGERLHLLRLDAVRPSTEGDPGSIAHLRFLSRTANGFLAEDTAGLQSRVVRELRTLVPRSVVVLSSFDPETDELTLRAIDAGAALEPLVSRFAALHLDEAVFRLGEADRSRLLLRRGLVRDDRYPADPVRLVRSRGGGEPVGATAKPLPYGALAAELHADSVWSIPLSWDEEPFGLVSILLRPPDEAPDGLLIETFVRQASAALHRERRTRSLHSALSEKETLLREIHHRVKNNLQIVASLLNLQSGYTRDEAAVRVLSEAADRVQSMALVHTMLYGSETLSSVNAADYLRSLATQIVRGVGAEARGVELRFRLEPLTLDADKAVPVGLIINELVTNAIKYGVGASGPGTITVGLSSGGGAAQVSVADTGCRLPPDFNPHGGSTLGMQLVSSLIRQLDGSLETSVGEVTLFRIHFPV